MLSKNHFRVFQTLFLFPLQFPVKMGINQSYVLVLLLASLSASYTSDCPTLKPGGQPAYDKCAKLYSILERALLENPGNLYQLHNHFFTNSGPEPFYEAVSFELNMEEQPQSSCWTSSALLRSVKPSVLTSLQPYPINILLLLVGVYGQTQLSINLKVNFTKSDYLTTTIQSMMYFRS